MALFSTPSKRRLVGGSAPGSAPSGPAAPSGEQPSTPGYVDFSRIIMANRPAAQQMADRLATGATQKGQAAQQAIQGAQAGFSAKVQGGTLTHTAPDEQASYVKDKHASGIATAQANSAKGYAGPKDWTEAGLDPAALASTAAAAQTEAQALASSAGRGALLRQQVKTPYSSGMSTLDAELSGAALGSRGREIANLYSGLSQTLTDARTAGGKQVEAARAASEAAAAKHKADVGWYQESLARRAREEEELRQRMEAERRKRYEESHLRGRGGGGALPGGAPAGGYYGGYG